MTRLATVPGVYHERERPRRKGYLFRGVRTDFRRRCEYPAYDAAVAGGHA